MTNHPLVSVIMAAHNAEKYIAEAIESVIAQTYPHWELIVVDDASTDATCTLVAQYTARDARITLLPLTIQVRQTAARIRAIAQSSGTYIAILDADDVCLPTRLETQVAYLEHHPEVAAVGSAALLIDEDSTPLGTKQKVTHPEDIRFKLLLQTQFVHSAVCMRRSAYEAVGGYDATYTLSAEDHDLWNRLAGAGYTLTNVPDTLVKYRLHAAGISQSDATGARTAMATDVSEKYVRLYMAATRAQVRRMIDLLQSKPLSLSDTLSALRSYRALVRAYCAKRNLSSTEARRIKAIYRDRAVHAIKIALKNIF